MEGSIGTLAAEIKAHQDGIRALDKDVSQATEQRKHEHEEHGASTAADSTAKEALGWAQVRLSKFYAPSLYKAPPGHESTEEQSITVNTGGTLAPIPAPGGIAGTGTGTAAAIVQVRSHSRLTREAPPCQVVPPGCGIDSRPL